VNNQVLIFGYYFLEMSICLVLKINALTNIVSTSIISIERTSSSPSMVHGENIKIGDMKRYYSM